MTIEIRISDETLAKVNACINSFALRLANSAISLINAARTMYLFVAWFNWNIRMQFYITHTVNRVIRKHELLWELDKQRIAKRAECGYYGRVL